MSTECTQSADSVAHVPLLASGSAASCIVPKAVGYSDASRATVQFATRQTIRARVARHGMPMHTTRIRTIRNNGTGSCATSLQVCVRERGSASSSCRSNVARARRSVSYSPSLVRLHASLDRVRRENGNRTILAESVSN